MTCPSCATPLGGLGTYCPQCEAYTKDLAGEGERRAELVLPLPINIANARMHWAQKNRKKKAYWQRCAVWEPRRPAAPIAPARLNATLYVYNRMDEDNLTARLKWTQDWLVERGWLLADHPDCLTLGDVSQEIDRKRTRIEVVLEAIA